MRSVWRGFYRRRIWLCFQKKSDVGRMKFYRVEFRSPLNCALIVSKDDDSLDLQTKMDLFPGIQSFERKGMKSQINKISWTWQSTKTFSTRVMYARHVEFKESNPGPTELSLVWGVSEVRARGICSLGSWPQEKRRYSEVEAKPRRQSH